MQWAGSIKELRARFSTIGNPKIPAKPNGVFVHSHTQLTGHLPPSSIRGQLHVECNPCLPVTRPETLSTLPPEPARSARHALASAVSQPAEGPPVWLM